MIRRITGSAVTTALVVAALGLACWFAFSMTTGAALVVFRTGSMSPTMPQGAAAITVPVRASELEVGDVVTVQRAGEEMPVTHRIVEIGPIEPQGAHAADIRAAAPGSGPPDLSDPDARQIVLRGDDNDAPDHLPYALEDARRVIFAVPHAGTALMMVQTPIGMGVLIIGAGVLVTWAFWPRASHGENRERAAAEADPALDAGPGENGADPAPVTTGGGVPGRHAGRTGGAEGALR